MPQPGPKWTNTRPAGLSSLRALFSEQWSIASWLESLQPCMLAAFQLCNNPVPVFRYIANFEGVVMTFVTPWQDLFFRLLFQWPSHDLVETMPEALVGNMAVSIAMSTQEADAVQKLWTHEISPGHEICVVSCFTKRTKQRMWPFYQPWRCLINTTSTFQSLRRIRKSPYTT